MLSTTYSNSSRQNDQRKILYEQAVEPTAAYPAVQLFVYPNSPAQSVGAEPNGCRSEPSAANSMFPGGQTEADLSNSLHHMLHLSQLQGPGLAEFTWAKGSVTWKLN
ncbi:hypothetical protein quinque_008805 [Culex quinquefasciatus]